MIFHFKTEKLRMADNTFENITNNHLITIKPMMESYQINVLIPILKTNQVLNWKFCQQVRWIFVRPLNYRKKHNYMRKCNREINMLWCFNIGYMGKSSEPSLVGLQQRSKACTVNVDSVHIPSNAYRSH